MQLECLRAQKYLEAEGVRAEVIDPIWLSPLDIDTIVESVRKTGRLIVVDNGWTTCGASAEIVAAVTERLQNERPISVRRLGFAPVTCPPTPNLEAAYYPDARTIAMSVFDLVGNKADGWQPRQQLDLAEVQFKGPF
jgi:pyruvate/2-oxoglutarate/acetoin dehydrogenase E1 component